MRKLQIGFGASRVVPKSLQLGCYHGNLSLSAFCDSVFQFYGKILRMIQEECGTVIKKEKNKKEKTKKRRVWHNDTQRQYLRGP